MCLQIQVLATHVNTSELYEAAEKRRANDEDRLESFYAFWENRDNCQGALATTAAGR